MKKVRIGDTVKISKKRMTLGDDTAERETKVVSIDANDIIFRTGKSLKKVSMKRARRDRSIVFNLANEFKVYGKDIKVVKKAKKEKSLD